MKNIIRDKEGYYIFRMASVLQNNITILSVYVQEEIDKNYS